MRFTTPMLAIGVLFLAITGCTPPHRDVRLADVQIPWDLSVQIHVQGQDGASDPMLQTAQFILDPSRKLRVATGSGADADYFPRVTRVITPQEHEQIARLVREFNLQVEPTSPSAQAAGGKPSADALPIYHVSIQAFGRRNRYATTPRESPPTAQLLAALVQLRGQTVGTGAREIPPGESPRSVVGAKNSNSKKNTREPVAP